MKHAVKRFLLFAAIIGFVFGAPWFSVSAAAAGEPAAKQASSGQLILGGELFGLKMQAQGLLLCDLGSVETAEGAVSPGERAGLEKGDLILSAAGIPLESAADLAKIISKSAGGAVSLRVERQGKKYTLSLLPARSADGSGWKGGLWVKDGIAGIGTVTFYDPESGDFGGLGHAVCDGESGVIFPLRSGLVCTAGLQQVRRGERGTPGEIVGSLGKDVLGRLSVNCPAGVFGTLREKRTGTAVATGTKSELHAGKASIFCTVDPNQGKKEYEIEIEEIFSENRQTKNFIIHVISPELLEKTGGIVQGMSGSPIVQDGKLVGAVTHVLVEDPTRGYGIFIENMLESANSVAEDNKQKEAS